jgi:hypothetical protein
MTALNQSDQQPQHDRNEHRSRSIVLGKINLLLASLGLLFLAGTYWLIPLLPEAFALLLLVLPPLMVAIADMARSTRTARVWAPASAPPAGPSTLPAAMR